MSIRTLARLGALSAALAVALCTSASASAHVTVTPTTTAAGSYTVAEFSVGHGCEESPTTRVSISIPEEILSVKPTRHPFWNAKVVHKLLAEPRTDGHGNQVTDRISEIVFTARQPLPDDVRDTLELSFQVPETVGETLVFPTVQTCARGETAWTRVPAEGQDHDELDTPAPSFTVTTAEAEHAEAAVETTAATEAGSAQEPAKVEESGGQAMGTIGAGAGLLGLAAGVIALARVRRRS